MKTRNIFISLLLTVLCAAPMYARQFEQGEKIYVNADQSYRDGEGKFNWSVDNANLMLYVWKKGVSNSQQWVKFSRESGSLFIGEMPVTGEFDQCILLRKGNSNLDFNGVYNRTGDMSIPNYANCNYLVEFWEKKNDEKGENSTWKTYAPALDKVGALAKACTEEKISICPSALGGPFSLRVKLNAKKDDYDYASVVAHAWYMSTNGTTWTSVDGYAGVKREEEFEQDILKNTLPSSGSVIYYYLHSGKPSGCRLIKVTTDGAKDCDLDCTITAIEIACSAVNANDTTYTLDGVVVFGEPSGDLVITCKGIDGNKDKPVTISSAKSPQLFHIEGLRAATKKDVKTTVVASFKGNAGCTMSKQFTVPNALEGRKDRHIDVLVGESKTIQPSPHDYSYTHEWYANNQKQTTQGDLKIVAPNEEKTDVYMYQEFNPPVGDMTDMMTNGGYEDDKFNYGEKGKTSTISDYNFWGLYAQTGNTAIDFYTNTAVNPDKLEDNGFAIVKNANNFFYTYANVKAREGNYFALFDAMKGKEGGNKKAWYTNTSKSVNMKLKKGTTYLFSFWAANINNYGEMDNAAKLQFQINGKPLGNQLDLNSPEFRNNRWHQCYALYTADADADNVTISVVNSNVNDLKTGNDFALDDIQFRAVSNNTPVVRTQQVFEVQTHEPAITKFTATPVQMNCDSDKYDVKLHIEYKNQISKIIVKDVTGGANRTVWEKNLTALTDGSTLWEKTQTLDPTVSQTIAAGDPLAKERKYKVYFEKWTKATKTVTFKDPVIPMMQVTYYNNPDTILPCGLKTYSISGTVTYRNMNANAYAWIDKATKVEISGLKQNDSNKLTASFTVSNVPADSAEHVLHVAFEGRGTTCPFEDTFRAAFAPVVDDVKFIGVPAELDCGVDSYTPQVRVLTSNHRNAVLTVEFDGQTPASKSRVVTADVTTFDYPSHPVDGGTYSAKVYFEYVHSTFADCEKSASFVAPEFTKCCTDGLIFRKWNNVLFVNNGDSSIVAYQWYKNDAKLDGETLQHLYTRATPMAGTTDLYHCVVTRKDGTEETLCEFTFDEFPSSAEASQAVAASVSVRPTRVPAGEAITITKSADETVQATLLTVTGQTVTTTSISDNESTMLMPHEPGLYLLKLQGTTIQSTVKINVF